MKMERIKSGLFFLSSIVSTPQSSSGKNATTSWKWKNMRFTAWKPEKA